MTLLHAILLTSVSSGSVHAGPSQVFTNPLFIVLALSALVLLGLIAGLASTLKNLAEAGRKKIRGTSLPVILFLLGGMLVSQPSFGQATSSPDGGFPSTIGGLDSWVFAMMMALIIAECLILFGLLRAMRQLMIGLGFIPEPSTEYKPLINWSLLNRRINDAVPVELEESVMTDHEYDGIRELDNNLPPWWKYGFYVTIVVSVIYMVNYHVLRNMPLSDEEYRNELAEAENQRKQRLQVATASIDENTVSFLNDATILNSGKEIYSGNCANCHGAGGEGGVGPNLTDEYWLHGGGIQNIFKTIKYGVPEKGMISWKQQLNPEAMQKVASYIMTLKGTKPANAKAPQGEIWNETSQPADSTAAAGPLTMRQGE